MKHIIYPSKLYSEITSHVVIAYKSRRIQRIVRRFIVNASPKAEWIPWHRCITASCYDWDLSKMAKQIIKSSSHIPRGDKQNQSNITDHHSQQIKKKKKNTSNYKRCVRKLFGFFKKWSIGLAKYIKHVHLRHAARCSQRRSVGMTIAGAKQANNRGERWGSLKRNKSRNTQTNDEKNCEKKSSNKSATLYPENGTPF